MSQTRAYMFTDRAAESITKLATELGVAESQAIELAIDRVRLGGRITPPPADPVERNKLERKQAQAGYLASLNALQDARQELEPLELAYDWARILTGAVPMLLGAALAINWVPVSIALLAATVIAAVIAGILWSQAFKGGSLTAGRRFVRKAQATVDKAAERVNEANTAGLEP